MIVFEISTFKLSSTFNFSFCAEFKSNHPYLKMDHHEYEMMMMMFTSSGGGENMSCFV